MTPAEKQANHMKWLKFAVLLCRTDLEGITAGQKLDRETELREFLESMPDPRNDQWVKLLTKGEIPEALPGLASLKRDDSIDLKRAKEVLADQIESLAGNNICLNATGIADILLWKMGDSIEYTVSPKRVELRLIAILGYHLKGAGIPASWLRRCPQCGEVFLAARSPRPDRKLHCSILCSTNAASKAFRQRQKLLPRAERLFRQGNSIDKIASITELDPDWLKSKLKKKRSVKK